MKYKITCIIHIIFIPLFILTAITDFQDGDNGWAIFMVIAVVAAIIMARIYYKAGFKS